MVDDQTQCLDTGTWYQLAEVSTVWVASVQHFLGYSSILKSGARTNLRFIRPGLSAEMCWLATVGSCVLGLLARVYPYNSIFVTTFFHVINFPYIYICIYIYIFEFMFC